MENLEAKRTKCEIYTRVMGYFRPVSHFNIGKKAEHYTRKHFDENKSFNSKFLEKYSDVDSMSPKNDTIGLSK